MPAHIPVAGIRNSPEILGPDDSASMVDRKRLVVKPFSVFGNSMKEIAIAVMETPLIGSGSQEEVDLRVQAIKDLGTSRGYLTYEELNEKLPDEIVSPDKLDSLLMMIDEMGIKLIDESDIGDFTKG